MRVNFYASFRLTAKTKSFTLDMSSPTTVDQAIQEIIRRFPDLKSQWMNEAGELMPHVHVFINKTDMNTFPERNKTCLATEDVLDFFPPVAGG